MKNLIIIILLLSFQTITFAFGKSDYKKDIHHSWNVNSITKVWLENKYGKMDIKTWDKNTVEVNITITVKTKNKDDANEVFERINIEFTETKNLVKAVTNIDSKKDGLFSFFSWSSDDYSIDWVVYMPKSNQLKLKNSYGNTSIEEMDGLLALYIKYGNLNLEKANNNLKLDLAYGDADIDKCDIANIELKYGEVKINQANKVNLDIMYSKLKINNANFIKLESKYDDIDLGYVGYIEIKTGYSDIDIKSILKLDMNAKYTELEVGLIEEYANISANYGEIDIKSIQKGFNKIEISGKYTDIDLKTGSDTYFLAELSSDYGNISVPKNFQITNTNSGTTNENISGYKGDINSQSIIIINCDKGDIDLK